jgi:hypothetical protein
MRERICMVLVSLPIVLVACGGSEPPPAAPPPHAESTQHASRPSLQMSQELGSLDEGKVDGTFQNLVPKFSDCLQKGSGRVEFIGGHVKFFVRIAPDGKAKWAYLSESTIGDRDTEKCMLGAIKTTSWPPPIGGGDGLAQKSFDFDPSPDVRAPVPWSPDRLGNALSSLRSKIQDCPAHARYQATAYVKEDGTILSAGVAVPDEKADAGSDCVVGAIKGLKLPSPGSWPAKVTFDVN